jgi:hypothetical protein
VALKWLARVAVNSMTDRRAKSDRGLTNRAGARVRDSTWGCVWLPRDWTPAPQYPLLIVMEDAADWRSTAQQFRNACAGRPLVILAPNLAVHSADSIASWIRDVSDECGPGGPHFVYGRGAAAALATSVVLRGCEATVALALIDPPALAPALRGVRVDAERVAVRAFFPAHDPQLAVHLDAWRESAAAARRAGFRLLDVAVVDAAAGSRVVDESLQFFDDVRVSAATRT